MSVRVVVALAALCCLSNCRQVEKIEPSGTIDREFKRMGPTALLSVHDDRPKTQTEGRTDVYGKPLSDVIVDPLVVSSDRQLYEPMKLIVTKFLKSDIESSGMFDQIVADGEAEWRISVTIKSAQVLLRRDGVPRWDRDWLHLLLVMLDLGLFVYVGALSWRGEAARGSGSVMFVLIALLVASSYFLLLPIRGEADVLLNYSLLDARTGADVCAGVGSGRISIRAGSGGKVWAPWNRQLSNERILALTLAEALREADLQMIGQISACAHKETGTPAVHEPAQD